MNRFHRRSLLTGAAGLVAGGFVEWLGLRGDFGHRDSVPRPRDARARYLKSIAALAAGGDAIVHVGHSTHLLSLGGVRVLADPWFHDPAHGGMRHTRGPAVRAEDAGPLDLIAITHEHPDHLDPRALDRLDKRALCVLPSAALAAPPRRAAPPKGRRMARMPYAGTMLRLSLVVALAAPLHACASSAPGTTTAARNELVVDEALVVTAAPVRDAHGLPPLPQPLAATSEVFQRGHAQAIALLEAAGPLALSGSDEGAYEAWTRGPFTEWMEARGAQTKAAVADLGAVQQGPASEHVVAAALVGMIYTRLTDQLVAIPPPAHLASDALLAKHYRKGLDDASDEWRKAAQGAFFHCAKHAALQTEASFGMWLELCHERLAALQAQGKAAEQRAAQLAAETEAARLKAAGPPPPGPEICWKPHLSRPSGDLGAVTRPSGDLGAVPAAAADRSSAGKLCALSSVDDEGRTPVAPVTARDAQYGVRDADSGVRVSVATEPLPSMDLHPLAAAAPHAAYAACFARHVKEDKAVTVAVHASLSADDRGHVKDVTISAEPSDQAAPPGRALERCLQKALKAVHFDCSPSGQATQGKALLCLRRD